MPPVIPTIFEDGEVVDGDPTSLPLQKDDILPMAPSDLAESAGDGTEAESESDESSFPSDAETLLLRTLWLICRGACLLAAGF